MKLWREKGKEKQGTVYGAENEIQGRGVSADCSSQDDTKDIDSNAAFLPPIGTEYEQNGMQFSKIAPSRAAAEWRNLHFAEARKSMQIDDRQFQPHYNRVEKLLARFQARKNVNELKSQPLAVHHIESSSQVLTGIAMSNSRTQIYPDSNGDEIPQATCYLSKPPNLAKWRGLGLVSKEANDAVEMLRTKNSTREKLWKGKINEVRSIGNLTLNLLEAKGMPRDDQSPKIHAFCQIRIFSTEQTTRPGWEARTKVQENEKLLTRTHKVKWCERFDIPVKSESSILEVEVCQSHDSGVAHDSHGFLRLQVKSVMQQSIEDAAFFLKRKDGTSGSISVSLSIEYQNNMGESEREHSETTDFDMPKENPLWISSWDASSVLAFKRDQSLIRERVRAALEEDTIHALDAIFKDIFRLDLEDEPASREAIQRLEELKLLRQQQEKAKLQLAAAVLDKSSSPFWLVKSLKMALMQAYGCGLSSNCEQVANALRFLEKVEEQTSNVVEDNSS